MWNAYASSPLPMTFCLCPVLWEGEAEQGLEVLDPGNVCSGISWVLFPCKDLKFQDPFPTLPGERRHCVPLTVMGNLS